MKVVIAWRRFSLNAWNTARTMGRFKRLRYAHLAQLVVYAAGFIALSPRDYFLVFSMSVTAFSLGWCARMARNLYEAERERDKLLTPPDLVHINTHRTCPDCVCGSLMLGPRGGCSINVKCNNPECRHEFSIAVHGGTALMGERLERDDASLYHEETFL